MIYLYNRSQQDALYFDIKLYMFRTDLLSIIRSHCIHTIYVDCLLADSQHKEHVELYIKIKSRNSAFCWLLLYEIWRTLYHGPARSYLIGLTMTITALYQKWGGAIRNKQLWQYANIWTHKITQCMLTWWWWPSDGGNMSATYKLFYSTDGTMMFYEIY